MSFKTTSELGDVTQLNQAHSGSSSHYEFKEDPYSSHAVILNLVGKSNGGRLLDVGAADGYLAKHFSERGWKVTGIERDSHSVASLRSYCHEVIENDLNQEIPKLRGFFDIIVYGDVLEHLLNPRSAFVSLNQYLAQDGLVIVSVPNIAHLWIRLSLLVGCFNYSDRGILDRTHLHFFTLKTFRRFLDDSGIQVSKIIPVPIPILNAIPDKFHGAWIPALQWIQQVLVRIWPRGFAIQYAAIGRRKK